MTEVWPEAPISALLYDEVGTHGRFAHRRVTTSFLQRTSVRQAGFRKLLPLMPLAAETLRVPASDVVVSSSSAFAHGIRPGAGTVHVCYCHSPFRYAWHERDRALLEAPRPLRPLLAGALAAVRRWDRHASTRVTHYIANSRITQQRIAEVYGRQAPIIHPPVDIDRFYSGAGEGYVLFVGQLVAHKRVEVALEAARLSGKPIKIVGTGPDAERLTRRYEATAEFLGRVDDEELCRLYAGADALVVPNVEEFGIAAVEAQAAGTPVVGTTAGGTAETVIDGETGVLVPPGDVGALAEVLSWTDFARFSGQQMQRHARRFSTEAFKGALRKEVERAASGLPL
jgi:glycosyltransferase involved in cell wall biosynthesis